MLYYKYSSNRIFFINEYWIFVPSAVFINYVILRKNRLNRKRMKELKRLTELLKREKRIRKVLLLSLGLNGYLHLLTRGGSTALIDPDYIKLLCEIDEGVGFLDDNRLRNIISNLYSHKLKGKVIYITATALCHLANQYSQTVLALPFSIGDFGLTNMYQTVRKGLVTILLGGVGPMLINGSPVALMAAFILSTSGLRLAFSNLDFIPISISPVDVKKGLEPRLPGRHEVVVVNTRDKIIMTKPVQKNQECWLADQRLLNPTCEVKTTEIPSAIDSVLPDLRYEETVNMKDVTGLDRVEFTDKFDIGQAKPSIITSPKAKEVKFLDKFGDSGPIGESEVWDTHENEFMVPEKRPLKTRNKP